MEKAVVIYGSMQCPDTVKALERLDKQGVEYRYVEILDSLQSLKEFLNIRDAHADTFSDAVAGRSVGIPVAMVNGSRVYKDLDKLDLSLLGN